MLSSDQRAPRSGREWRGTRQNPRPFTRQPCLMSQRVITRKVNGSESLKVYRNSTKAWWGCGGAERVISGFLVTTNHSNFNPLLAIRLRGFEGEHRFDQITHFTKDEQPPSHTHTHTISWTHFNWFRTASLQLASIHHRCCPRGM